MTPQPGDSLLEAFEHWQEAADKKACCDYSLHVDIPQWNEAVKDELELLVHEKGTTAAGCSKVFQSCGHCCNPSFSNMFIPSLGPFHKNNRDRFGNNRVESSYSEVTAEIHCPHYGAVMVALCKFCL